MRYLLLTVFLAGCATGPTYLQKLEKESFRDKQDKYCAAHPQDELYHNTGLVCKYGQVWKYIPGSY